jgi:hypothetical protein
MVHPRGFVEVDLRRDGEALEGTVTLPHGVSGAFCWRGNERPLDPGENVVG